MFLNGVHWSSVALAPTEVSGELDAVISAIDAAQLGLRQSVDPHDESVTVFLPLVELESYLGGLPSDLMEWLRRCVEGLEAAGRAVRVTVSTQISNDPEPVLAVRLRPAVGVGAEASA